MDIECLLERYKGHLYLPLCFIQNPRVLWLQLHCVNKAFFFIIIIPNVCVDDLISVCLGSLWVVGQADFLPVWGLFVDFRSERLSSTFAV